MEPNDLNLRQLRAELKKLGLSPSGLKSSLVKRLKTALGQKDDSDVGEGAEKAPEKEELKLKKVTKPKRRNFIKHKVILHRFQKPVNNMASSESPLGDVEGEEEPAHVSDAEAKQIEAVPFDKRRIIGLNDRELRRRKAAKRKREDENPNETQFPNLNGLSETQLEFFSQAALELERIKVARRYESDILKLQNQIESMREELERKSNLIGMLQQIINDKDEALMSLGACTIPKELVRNWSAMTKLLQPQPPTQSMLLV